MVFLIQLRNSSTSAGMLSSYSFSLNASSCPKFCFRSSHPSCTTIFLQTNKTCVTCVKYNIRIFVQQEALWQVTLFSRIIIGVNSFGYIEPYNCFKRSPFFCSHILLEDILDGTLEVYRAAIMVTTCLHQFRFLLAADSLIKETRWQIVQIEEVLCLSLWQ